METYAWVWISARKPVCLCAVRHVSILNSLCTAVVEILMYSNIEKMKKYRKMYPCTQNEKSQY